VRIMWQDKEGTLIFAALAFLAVLVAGAAALGHMHHGGGYWLVIMAISAVCAFGFVGLAIYDGAQDQ